MPKRSETFNGQRSYMIGGRYFELLSAPAAVGIRLYVSDKSGGERLVESLDSVDAGWSHTRVIGQTLLEPLVRAEIINPGNQATAFSWSDGTSTNRSVPADITDDATRILGLQNVRPAAIVPVLKTAGAADAQLSAANATRKYISIQNQSATENAFITTDGSAATATGAAFKIAPGETWAPLVPPTGEIRMIRGAAADVTLNVLEG